MYIPMILMQDTVIKEINQIFFKISKLERRQALWSKIKQEYIRLEMTTAILYWVVGRTL